MKASFRTTDLRSRAVAGALLGRVYERLYGVYDLDVRNGLWVFDDLPAEMWDDIVVSLAATKAYVFCYRYNDDGTRTRTVVGHPRGLRRPAEQWRNERKKWSGRANAFYRRGGDA